MFSKFNDMEIEIDTHVWHMKCKGWPRDFYVLFYF
jgi:hypothetical protein